METIKLFYLKESFECMNNIKKNTNDVNKYIYIYTRENKHLHRCAGQDLVTIFKSEVRDS